MTYVSCISHILFYISIKDYLFLDKLIHGEGFGVSFTAWTRVTYARVEWSIVRSPEDASVAKWNVYWFRILYAFVFFTDVVESVVDMGGNCAAGFLFIFQI